MACEPSLVLAAKKTMFVKKCLRVPCCKHSYLVSHTSQSLLALKRRHSRIVAHQHMIMTQVNMIQNSHCKKKIANIQRNRTFTRMAIHRQNDYCKTQWFWVEGKIPCEMLKICYQFWKSNHWCQWPRGTRAKGLHQGSPLIFRGIWISLQRNKKTHKEKKNKQKSSNKPPSFWIP